MPNFIRKPFVQPVYYKGKLSDYQIYGENRKRYVEYEKDEFTPEQNFLYRRALFGLSVYSDQELSIMHSDKKKRINKVHFRTQNVLNLWKQSLVNDMVNSIFNSMFYHSSLAKQLVESFGDTTDPTYISRVDFKSLGVSKKQIIKKLMEEKILPVNFYEL
jgi:hypothetical protein